MELLLSAISAGGLVGASNQYLCLLLVSIAAKTGLVTLAEPMAFMESWWFIGIVALFWLLTVAPAYGTTLGPGVMNVVNTVSNFLSGFAVPVSAAFLALAAAGIIAGMDPTLRDILTTMQLFNASGGIGVTGYIAAGGSAVAASALTGARFLAKPALSTATGTTGTVSAPIYATIENVASVVLMGLFILLARINPWLLVGLFTLVALLILGALAFAIYQLWKLGRDIGRVLWLIEMQPKAGLAVVAEALVWGSGWLTWKHWQRGAIRLVLWALWLALVVLAIPAAITAAGVALAAVAPLAMLASALGIAVEAIVILAGLYAGLRSAGGLLKTFGEIGSTSTAAHAPLPAQA
jgi:hypothetical protein